MPLKFHPAAIRAIWVDTPCDVGEQRAIGRIDQIVALAARHAVPTRACLDERPRDFSQGAKLVVDIATGQVEDRGPTPEEQGKDAAAVAMGRKGGQILSYPILSYPPGAFATPGRFLGGRMAYSMRIPKASRGPSAAPGSRSREWVLSISRRCKRG
jgi:hypothetical protein